jgi:presenilin-like A22 family membrane protease
MFLITQFLGLYIIDLYQEGKLPYGMQPPEMKPEVSFYTILISIFLAISFVFLLMKIKAAWVIRIWFFSVIALAIAITSNAFFQKFLTNASIISLALGLALSYLKIFRRNIIIHNLTEILIYPGIAAIFVPLLNIFSAFILLILISIYDIYAVWYAKFMQEMAKFQIKEMKFFAGFFVPYIRGKQIRSINFRKGQARKIKVSLAILGGGDVVFPILAAGVVFRAWGLLPALAVSLLSSLGLLALFALARKGKFYPAMPFITAGSFVGLLIAFLLKSFLL